MLQLCRKRDLPLEALHGYLPQHLGRQHLHHHLPSQRLFRGEIHVRHTAATTLALDGICVAKREIELGADISGHKGPPLDSPLRTAHILTVSTSIERLSAALADRYRIDRELGAGGMATVYLAADLKHDRNVAIKVLKPELAAVLGAERFVVEIKTTAALQHPHILPLFDSGDADGFLYYVMPYIEGETIREKLNRETQFSVDEAVRITREIADALDYAHRNGVIHRDIKPENILLHDGRAMVMDFGIALAVSAAAGGRMTETGLSLGTPHYMSPEQATAEKEISGRSDVYSLGSVLYEMLAGNPPHTGASAQQIIMKIITESAEAVTKYRKSVPPNVEAAVAKSLEKLPADRFESARAFADALRDPGFTTGASTRLHVGAKRNGTGNRQWLAAAIVGLVVLAAGIGGGMFIAKRDVSEPEVVRFEAPMPAGARRPTSNFTPFAISPDGRTMVVLVGYDSAGGKSLLYRRNLGQLTGAIISGTEGAYSPFFSPDGKWVGFFTGEGAVKKVPLNGGSAIALAPGVNNIPFGAAWLDDGTIVYGGSDAGLKRVGSAGGAVSAVLNPANADYYWPAELPGATRVLALRCAVQCEKTDLVALDLKTGKATVVVAGGTRGWYLDGGTLVYGTTDNALFAVAFDPATLAIKSEPVPVLSTMSSGVAYGIWMAVSSKSGSMMYLPSAGSALSTLVAVDRSGIERTVLARPDRYAGPRWSPDGKRVATFAAGLIAHVWVHDLAANTATELTQGTHDIRPAWSPDGTQLIYSTASAIMRVPADGSRPPSRLLNSNQPGANAVDWSADGKWIITDGFWSGPPSSQKEDVYAIPVDGVAPRRAVVSTPGNDQLGSTSPDGKWIAYNSDESERNKVYVRPFMAEGGKFLISEGGAVQPRWISNRELVYVDDTGMLTVAALKIGTTVEVVKRTALFSIERFLGGRSNSAWVYDVSRDGKEFLFAKRVGAEVVPQATVVLHWSQELAKRIREQGNAR